MWVFVAYFAGLTKELLEANKKKRWGKLSKAVLLLHDNASVYKAIVFQTAIEECEFEELGHLPYSPDQASSY